jgi:hypothetical protein
MVVNGTWHSHFDQLTLGTCSTVRPTEAALMCDKCDKIEDSIARYKRLKDQINDRQTRDAADCLLAGLQTKKATLHAN